MRPYTTRAQRVLGLADTAAASLGHQYVGSEHLLLGLVDEKTGIAAQILHDHGLSPESVRDSLARLFAATAAAAARPNEEL